MEVLVPHLVRVAVILDGLDLAALLVSKGVLDLIIFVPRVPMHVPWVVDITNKLNIFSQQLSVALLVKVEENVWLQTLASVQAVWKDLFAVQVCMCMHILISII